MSHWERRKAGCADWLLYTVKWEPLRIRYTIVVDKLGSRQLVVKYFAWQSQGESEVIVFGIRREKNSNLVNLLDKDGKTITAGFSEELYMEPGVDL